jgi:hypothetical protein
VPIALPALVATLRVLSAQAATTETATLARPAPVPLARSSIAAVLAQAGSLGLTAEQVKDLERRDAALQREQAAIRERFATPAEGPSARSPLTFTGPGGGAGPGAGGGPGGMTGGPGGAPGGMGGGPGGRGKAPQGARARPEDPKERAARMVKELDDADTHAWLEAAGRLPPALEEKATVVAARYREDVAAAREAEPGDAAPRP